MPKEPLQLSVIRTRLASILDNVSRSNAGGIENAQFGLRALETDLYLKADKRQQHAEILGIVLAARAALQVGRIEETGLNSRTTGTGD